MPAHIEIGSVMGGGAPCFAPVPFHAETIATTSSTQTTVPARSGDYANVIAIGAAVMVAIGPNPTAVAGGARMYRCEPGLERTFGPLKEGDRIAAINAT